MLSITFSAEKYETWGPLNSIKCRKIALRVGAAILLAAAAGADAYKNDPRRAACAGGARILNFDELFTRRLFHHERQLASYRTVYIYNLFLQE